MAASCINTVTEYVIVMAMVYLFFVGIYRNPICKDGISMFGNRSWRFYNCVYFVYLSTGIGKTR